MSLYNKIAQLVSDAYEQGKLDAELDVPADLSPFYNQAYIISDAAAEFCPHYADVDVPEPTEEAKASSSPTLKD